MNLYEILEVSKESSQQEIKKSYRLQAKKHHPDKGGEVEKFKQVKFAYEILSNIEKRKRYDTLGATENRQNIQNLARQEVAALLNLLLTDKNNKNLLKKAIKAVKEEQKKLKTFYHEIFKIRKFLLNRKSKIKSKISLEDDLIFSIFRIKRIENINNFISLREKRKVFLEMLNILESYSEENEIETSTQISTRLEISFI